MKEIHFHLSLATTTDLELCTTYLDTMFALENKTPVIHTTSIEFLSTGLFWKGYRIFVHFQSGRCLEFKLGEKHQTAACCSRETT